MTTTGNGLTENGFRGTTHLLAVLDKSGSMGVIRDQTISGFNEFLGDLQRTNPNDPLTLVLFDTVVTTPVSATPAKDVNPLDSTRYAPSGNTALYDAMVRAIREVEAIVKADDRVLVVIVTDGQENSSKETTREQALALVAQLEGRGNWTFTYLSASPTAFADAHVLGVSRGATARFEPTDAGAKAAWDVLRSARLSYSASSAPQAKSFYSGDDPSQVTNIPPAATIQPPTIVVPPGQRRETPWVR